MGVRRDTSRYNRAIFFERCISALLSVSSFMRNAPAFIVFCLLIQPAAIAQITLDPLPSRVIGQNSVEVSNVNPNLVEGREFFAPEAVALDMSTRPPGLYVADAGNNRVLGFRNAASFGN